MHKLAFQNVGVGVRPGLQHRLTFRVRKSQPRFLLHLSRTGPFLPSPAHDIWTTAVATSPLLSCATQSAPLGAARRSLGHPTQPLLRTFPGTYLTGSQSQVLIMAFVAPVPLAPHDLLTLSAAIPPISLLHYSTLLLWIHTRQRRPFAPAASSSWNALPAGALPSLPPLGLSLTGTFPERPPGHLMGNSSPFPARPSAALLYFHQALAFQHASHFS